MTFLIVFSVILLIVLGVLFIPVVVDLEYTEDFKFKVKFLNITLFKTKPPKPKKQSTTEKKKPEPKEKSSVLTDAKKRFNSVKEKEGFTGAVKEAMAFAGEVLSHIKWLLRYINICKVKLQITVGTKDAAKTAYEYGLICQAVYPVTAMLDSVAHIGFKEISVDADFEGESCSFEFKGTVKMQIFYLLICAFKIYKTLKKFVTEKKRK